MPLLRGSEEVEGPGPRIMGGLGLILQASLTFSSTYAGWVATAEIRIVAWMSTFFQLLARRLGSTRQAATEDYHS